MNNTHYNIIWTNPFKKDYRDRFKFCVNSKN